MANTPKKIKDPTEAALSAIQDALSARDAAAAPPAPPVMPPEEAPLEWRTTQTVTPGEEVSQPEEQSLPRRPARTSYVTASVFAGLWVLVGLVLGWMYLPELQSTLGPSGLAAPVLIMLAVVFFVPIIFFYVLAYI